MHTKIKQSIIELAKISTEEICGFIYATHNEVKIYPCTNIAADRTTNFEISKGEYLDCIRLGVVIAVYHSHPNGPASFSEWDLAVSKEAALPFYMYDVPSGEWFEYLPPTYSVKLEGRPFYWGFDDCYGTVRHYYRETLGLYLRDYDRDDNFGPSKSMAIMDHFADEGFVCFPPTEIVKPHDALLFDISKHCPQHLSVFVGNQRMFHHPLNALSHIDFLDGRYLSRLAHVLRHKTLLDSV
jgi:proteasome lid subunit RPN8/RPN11